MAEEIIRTEYSEIMQKSFIDYSMSVILARAVPDVRDGLKPVQRRTLYDMYELKVDWNKPYKKSARIVGDTMGKYHPHGDSSIYESLVVMSQDFKRSLPLVDGHGNFGSIEGDGAAAMRYTEARLAKVTQDVYLADLDKNIVDFVPNYDENEKEPSVLPVRVPNILINGSDGIAVGMVTSIPQHNLSEVIDGVIAYMKDPDINTAQMLSIIPGPDFPTGGIITNKDDLLEIYSTGVGKIKIRGKAEIEKIKGGKEQIVITEIPYTMIGANIGKFLNDVYSLVENKKTNDIVDISNQSSKDGMRIIIELRKGADANNVLNLLYKKTRLEDTFGVNMLAICDGKPETLGIVPIIRHHVQFQFELCTRKYTTLLAKERDKKEIQEGLIKACDVIDLIIEILRGSKDVKQAKACLVEGITEGIKFKSEQSKKDAAKLLFTDRQAQAILEMRLQKLIGLEIEALRGDYAETMQKISDYTKILESKAQMAKVIIKDLNAIKKEFGRDRRTVIDNVEEAVFEELPVTVYVKPVDGKGAKFYKWIDKDSKKISSEATLEIDNPQNKTVTAIDINKDAISSEFSVSATKKVCFSPGNLQATYNGSDYTWGFAENQYSFVGNNAGNTTISTQSTGNVVDLFGWSALLYGDPNWGISDNKDDDTYLGLFEEWGKNISVGEYDSKWYTLTKDEWNYLLSRKQGETYKELCVLVMYVESGEKKIKGLLLYPDDYTGTIALVNSEIHVIPDGAVFLPYAGERSANEDKVNNVKEGVGNYWSGTNNGDFMAYRLGLSTQVWWPSSTNRYNGHSVRLVSEIKGK